jgi:hypothetical protein
MTANDDDAEFAEIDSYITRQLRDAAAGLTAHADTQARLHAVFRAADQDGKHNGGPDITQEN